MQKAMSSPENTCQSHGSPGEAAGGSPGCQALLPYREARGGEAGEHKALPVAEGFISLVLVHLRMPSGR